MLYSASGAELASGGYRSGGGGLAQDVSGGTVPFHRFQVGDLRLGRWAKLAHLAIDQWTPLAGAAYPGTGLSWRSSKRR